MTPAARGSNSMEPLDTVRPNDLEPYAVVPHVRICAGGWGQPQSLPRPLAECELAELERAFAARTQPLQEERTALRRAFKAGGLSQRDYQGRLKELGERAGRVDRERREAAGAISGRFVAWLEGRCGGRVSLAKDRGDSF